MSILCTLYRSILCTHTYNMNRGDNRWADKNFVLEKVRSNGGKLRHASDELKGDCGVVMAAIRNAPMKALMYCSKELTSNAAFYTQTLYDGAGNSIARQIPVRPEIFDLMTEAVSTNGRALQYVPNTLKDHDEFVMRLIPKDPIAITWASERLRNSKSFVMKAVARHHRTLKYLPESMQDDEEVVTIAIRSDAKAIVWASSRLRDDETFLKLHLPLFKKCVYFVDVIRNYAYLTCFSERIKNLIMKDPNYLENYDPQVNIKPAKR